MHLLYSLEPCDKKSSSEKHNPGSEQTGLSVVVLVLVTVLVGEVLVVTVLVAVLEGEVLVVSVLVAVLVSEVLVVTVVVTVVVVGVVVVVSVADVGVVVRSVVSQGQVSWSRLGPLVASQLPVGWIVVAVGLLCWL